MKLRRASLAVTKLYDRYLKPSGLTTSQYSILTGIRRLAPVSVSDLAAETQLDRTTMVRNLKPLENQGLISDISDPGTRNRQLILTKSGEEKLNLAKSMWLKAQDEVERELGKSQLAMLSALLLKVETLYKL